MGNTNNTTDKETRKNALPILHINNDKNIIQF